MKDFLEIVVRQLVDHPEQVVVEEEESENSHFVTPMGHGGSIT